MLRVEGYVLVKREMARSHSKILIVGCTAEESEGLVADLDNGLRLFQAKPGSRVWIKDIDCVIVLRSAYEDAQDYKTWFRDQVMTRMNPNGTIFYE